MYNKFIHRRNLISFLLLLLFFFLNVLSTEESDVKEKESTGSCFPSLYSFLFFSFFFGKNPPKKNKALRYYLKWDISTLNTVSTPWPEENWVFSSRKRAHSNRESLTIYDVANVAVFCFQQTSVYVIVTIVLLAHDSIGTTLLQSQSYTEICTLVAGRRDTPASIRRHRSGSEGSTCINRARVTIT